MSILVLGDLLIDEYWFGHTTRLSPEAPVPVITGIRKELRAGGAGSVALNIKNMGSPVKLSSQCEPMEDLAALLGDLPHDMIACERTPHKTRIITDDHVICRLDDERYQGVAARASWIPADTSICVLSDYNKGFLHSSREIIGWCRDRGIRTIVDPKKDWMNYENCWLLKSNAKELEDQIRRSVKVEDLRYVCQDLSQQHRIDNIVVTLGHRGMYVWTYRGGTMIEAEHNHVIDVTGAGDVVLAALAHYTYQGVDLVSAAERANALAAISVSRQGACVMTPDDMVRVEGKVVFTNGCFDILHKGHLDYLRRSRALGTKLIVGINSDRSVRELKGPGRPINSEEDRKAMLESLEFVDEVIIFDEPTPRELIRLVKPDIITKGGDYTVDQVVGNDLVNQVVIIPFVDGYSTSKILERLDGERRT